MPRTVLLDIDGTLVDSNDAHARAWVDAFAEEGVQVDYDAVRRCIGMGGDKLMPAVCDISEDTPKGKRIAARRSEIFQQKYLPHLKAFPRAGDLVSALQARGFKAVAASSAKKHELKPLLSLAGADRLVDGATSSDDAEESKPDPDIVQAALKEAGARPDEAIMIGDTPYDIEAAGRAGVAVVAFRCGGWKDPDLKGAVAIYDGPADLLAQLDRSPFGAA